MDYQSTVLSINRRMLYNPTKTNALILLTTLLNAFKQFFKLKLRENLFPKGESSKVKLGSLSRVGRVVSTCRLRLPGLKVIVTVLVGRLVASLDLGRRWSENGLLIKHQFLTLDGFMGGKNEVCDE